MIVEGIVIKGKGEGSALGFPTANVAANGALMKSGVFAGRVYIGDEITSPNPSLLRKGEGWSAALYVPEDKSMVEAYLLDFSGDLYGVKVKIEILQKIRDSANFLSKDEAKRSIAEDIKVVKKLMNLEHKT